MRASTLINRRILITARTLICNRRTIALTKRAFQASAECFTQITPQTISADAASHTITEPSNQTVTGKYEFVDFTPARPELYIDTVPALQALLEQHLEPFDTIGIDTEFLTNMVYRPQLHVIQVSSPTIIAAIDYQAFKGKTIRPLFELFNRKTVILHSCQSDLAILSHLNGVLGIEPRLPPRIFDTQIAAAFLGYGDMIGYAVLLNRLFGVDLSKKDTMTDWSKRPLTASQLQYAWNDVRHLHQVHQRLSEELEAAGRTSWAAAEFALLSDPLIFSPINPEHAWRTVWMGKKLADHSLELSVLQSVAEWRERLASTKDMMNSIVMRHEALYAIAVQMPKSLEDLQTIQGLKPWVMRKHANDILRAVERGISKHRKLRHRVPHKQAGRLREGLVNMLLSRSAAVAAANSISQYQLAPRQELFDLASVSKEAVEHVMSLDQSEFKPAPMVCNFFGVKHDQLPIELSTAPASHYDDTVDLQVNEQYPLHRTMSLAEDIEMLKKLKVLTGWRREMVGHDLLAIVQGESLTWNQNTEQAGLYTDNTSQSTAADVNKWVSSMSPTERKALAQVIESINAGLTHIHSAANDSTAPAAAADQAVLSELQAVLDRLVRKHVSEQAPTVNSSTEFVPGQSSAAASA